VQKCEGNHFGCNPNDWHCFCRNHDWQGWYQGCCRDNCKDKDFHGAGQAVEHRCRKEVSFFFQIPAPFFLSYLCGSPAYILPVLFVRTILGAGKSFALTNIDFIVVSTFSAPECSFLTDIVFVLIAGSPDFFHVIISFAQHGPHILCI
jgi:hypothetical protein